MKQSSNKNRTGQSVQRVIDVLDLFTVEHIDWSVSEVAKRLHSSNSTISRTMARMAQGGLLERPANNGRYRPGGKILELAGLIMKTGLSGVAMPYLKELKEITSESISVFSISDVSRICVAKIEGTNYLRAGVDHIGQHLPLHAGSGGKVILAHLPRAKVREIINKTKLPRFTGRTFAEKSALITELAKIRKEGVAVSTGEFFDDVSSVAAPIFDPSGEAAGSLVISGYSKRFTPEKVEEYKTLVKGTAARISRDLGWSESL